MSVRPISCRQILCIKILVYSYTKAYKFQVMLINTQVHTFWLLSAVNATVLAPLWLTASFTIHPRTPIPTPTKMQVSEIRFHDDVIKIKFPAQRPVTRSIAIFFDLRLNNDWVNTPNIWDAIAPIWRHCNEYHCFYLIPNENNWARGQGGIVVKKKQDIILIMLKTSEIWHKYSFRLELYAWWRHQMEKFSASLALCAWSSPVTGEFLTQRPVTRSFDIFFHLCLNKRLSNQPWGWWFETLSRPLWRRTAMDICFYAPTSCSEKSTSKTDTSPATELNTILVYFMTSNKDKAW